MEKKRLFLDMDGMLAEYRTFVNEEQYLQPGYYISLSPHQNVIDGIKKVIAQEPNIEIFTLSAYFDSPNAIAVEEKNAWLDKHLPEIKLDHRIYTLCGQPKQNFIPGGITENDYLMDDYTKNLEMWEDGNGKGIKLLNGINGRIGKWDGPKISYKKSADEIAKSIIDIVNRGIHIQDKVNEMQLRNETQGLTMFISRERLSEIVDMHFPEYENVDDFRSNFTLEDWRFIKRLEPSVEIKENTSIKQFEFEYNTFKTKFYDKLDMLRRNAIEKQIDNIKNKVQLSFILSRLQKIQTGDITVSSDEIKAMSKTVADTEKNFYDAYNQWKEYKANAYDNLFQSISQFFKKYINMSVQDRKEFIDTLNGYKSKMSNDIFVHQNAIERIDKDEINKMNSYIEKINSIYSIVSEIKMQDSHTYISKETIEDEVLSDNEKPINNTTSFVEDEPSQILD